MLGLTHMVRALASRRLDRLDRMEPVAAQRITLERLVRRAERTRFGRRHGFARIRAVEDFQARVPLRCYEDFWEEFWKGPFPAIEDVTWPGRIPFLATTSGTMTGKSKLIPVSREMIRSNRRAALFALMRHVRATPRSGLLDGRILLLGGTTALENLAPAVRSGDLSGISAATVPWWLSRHVHPRRELALIPEWERRIGMLLRDPASRGVRAIAGQTPWLLSFLERALQGNEDGRRGIGARFPRLELILCGGVNFAPYRSRFEAIASSRSPALREAYVASEGFIAIGGGYPGTGMRPLFDNGLFLEFVPLSEIDAPNPCRHWIANVEPGTDYAVAVSSNAGLWAYLIGDIVRFVDHAARRLVITGRTGQLLSAFGERLIEAEITEAVMEAAQRVGFPVAEFAVGPRFPARPGDAGLHLYVVEFVPGVPPPEHGCRFIETVDAALKRTNRDYEDTRSGDRLMGPPALLAVPRGTFEGWMKNRGKLGGQNKVPRILLDPELLGGLERFARQTSPAPRDGSSFAWRLERENDRH